MIRFAVTFGEGPLGDGGLLTDSENSPEIRARRLTMNDFGNCSCGNDLQ